MSKHLKIGVLSLSFLIVLLVVLGGLGVHAASNNNDGAYRQLGVYSEVLSRIRTEYVEEPNFSPASKGPTLSFPWCVRARLSRRGLRLRATTL